LNDLVLLGILHRGKKPMHAYAIQSVVERHRIGQWARISKTGVYGRIKILDERGWVKSVKIRDGNMPERTEYELTSKGRERLCKMVDACIRSGGFYFVDFNAAMAFADALSREQLLDCLNDRLARATEERDHLRADIEEEKGGEFNFEIFQQQFLAVLDSHMARVTKLIKKIESDEQ